MSDSDEILVLPEPDDEETFDSDFEDYDPVDWKKRALIFFGVGLAFGVIGALAASWYWRPAAYDPSDLQAEIASLSAKIDRLEAKPEPTIPTVNLGPIRSRLEALEARPTVDPLNEEVVRRMEALQADGFELPDIPDLAPMTEQISAIEARLDQLETEIQMQAQAQAAALEKFASQQNTPRDPSEQEAYVDPKSLPRFPASALREGAAEMGGSGFVRRTFSRHVRVRGSDNPDVLISGIESDLANGKPRAALAKFDRLPPQLQSLARAWRADMEDALR